MTQKHIENNTHIRIYTAEGLVASFNVDMDAVELASEIFEDYVRRD